MSGITANMFNSSPSRPTDKFWVVWQHNSRNPQVKHASYHEAVKEAERLAALPSQSTGKYFFVLECRGYATQVVIPPPVTFVEVFSSPADKEDEHV